MKTPFVVDIGGRKVPLTMSPFGKYDDHIFTLSEFIHDVKEGYFIDYDGYGYYATDKEKSNKMIRPSHIKKGKVDHSFTHVVWYNR
jgi:hypothetical protein